MFWPFIFYLILIYLQLSEHHCPHYVLCVLAYLPSFISSYICNNQNTTDPAMFCVLTFDLWSHLTSIIIRTPLTPLRPQPWPSACLLAEWRAHGTASCTCRQTSGMDRVWCHWWCSRSVLLLFLQQHKRTYMSCYVSKGWVATSADRKWGWGGGGGEGGIKKHERKRKTGERRGGCYKKKRQQQIEKKEERRKGRQDRKKEWNQAKEREKISQKQKQRWKGADQCPEWHKTLPLTTKGGKNRNSPPPSTSYPPNTHTHTHTHTHACTCSHTCMCARAHTHTCNNTEEPLLKDCH